MKVILSSLPVAFAMALSLATAPALAQSALEDAIGSADVIVPASNFAHPELGQRFHTNLLIRKSLEAMTIQPQGGLGPQGGMTPAQVRSFYGMPSTGGSQIIAIIDSYDLPNALKDFNAFSKEFGLPQETSKSVTSSTNKVFQVVYQGGKKPSSSIGSGWDVEEALDIEWSHAMAPDAKIVLIEAQDQSNGLFTAISMATKMANVKEVSMSWGGEEDSSETTDDSFFTTGKEVVYFAASGDYGKGVIYPAASPNVVSVGGTTVNTNSKGKFVSETGWSGSGGGPSTVEKKPSYQDGIAHTNAKYRSVPDVAALADPNTGVSMYEASNGGWFVVGGTSVATPLMAGMTNLAGHFYADSPTELDSIYTNMLTDFRDIVKGNNGYPCQKDYDYVTGVGTPQGTGGI